MESAFRLASELKRHLKFLALRVEMFEETIERAVAFGASGDDAACAVELDFALRYWDDIEGQIEALRGIIKGSDYAP